MMIDYIMRLDALIDVCIGCNEEFPNEPCEPNDCKIKRALSGIPTVDVVEVVRCKDCKHHAEFSSKCNKLNLTPMWSNDYCSYGERTDT